MRDYDIPELGFFRVVLSMFRLLSPYSFQTGFLILLMLASSVFEAVGISAVVPILHAFVGDGGGIDTSNRVLVFYTHYLNNLSPEQRLEWLGLGIVFVFACRYLLSYCAAVMGDRLSYLLFVEIRQQVLGFYFRQPYRFFLDRKQGQLINDLSKEPGFLSQSLKDLINFISAVLSGSALMCVLIMVSWQSTIAVFVLGGMMWGISQGAKGWVHKIGIEGLSIRREVMTLPTEIISGIRQVKVFSAEQRLGAIFSQIGQKDFRNSLRLSKTTHLIKNLNHLLVITVFGFGLFLGIRLGLFTSETAAVSLLPFFAIASRFTPYLSLVNEFQVKIKARGASIDVLMPMILGTEPKKHTGATASFNTLKQSIVFEDVNFQYQDA